MNKIRPGFLPLLFAIVLVQPLAAQAQTPAAQGRNVEIISVDGTDVVVRDHDGQMREYSVPPDFTLTVKGEEVPLSNLEAGTQGVANLDPSDARAVHVTNITMGTVVSQVGRSVTVREADGRIHRFTQSEADERGVRLYMDGRPVRVFELEPGDQLSATVISRDEPEILTAADLDEELATAGQAAEEAGEAVGDTAATAAAETGEAIEDAAEEVTEPAGALGERWLWILIALVVVALIIWLLARKPKRPVVTK